jgi:glycosyltransferase involved in cell wall biosynthesis
MTPKIRLLLVSRTRYSLPLSHPLERKFDALTDRFDLRVLATSGDGLAHDDGRFRLLPKLPALDGVLFWVLLPWRIRKVVREYRPDAILAQSPYEAGLATLARSQAPVFVELHGDWRTATRLYGSPLRRVLAPLADAFGAWSIRHAKGIRTLSPFTTRLVRELGREPDGEFVAFMDLEPFVAGDPVALPQQPEALFVGVLELYKNIDGLTTVWRRIAPQLPSARLRLVGDGPRHAEVEELVRDLPSQTDWVPQLPPEGVARALDGATVLVLPSRSEGLGRVIIEAFLRGRPVIATRVGGIPDVIEDGINGLLVDDDAGLEAALVRVLGDRQLAERLGAGARRSANRWVATPADFAESVYALVRPYTGRP